MKTTFKILIFLGFIAPLNLLAMEHEIKQTELDAYVNARYPNLTTDEKIAQARAPKHHSALMYGLNNFVGKYEKKPSEISDATEHEQALCKKAQETLGIPTEHQLPVKKSNLEFATASCTPNAIYLNKYEWEEAGVKKSSYGKLWVTILHEAAHHKYLDVTNINLRKYAIFFNTIALTGTFLYKKLPIKSNITRIFIATPLALFSTACSVITDQFFLRTHVEQRADHTAAYACACATCVREKAEIRPTKKQSTSSFVYRFYLCSEELHEIANELAQANKYCDYHKPAQ